VVPNGVDESFLEVAAQAAEGAAPCGPFIVTYIGTLGMAHHLETLLEAARMMQADNGVRFRLVGEGAQRSALESRARQMNLTNVEFAGERPREEVPRWIAESDACAVLLRKTPVFHTVVPSKMLEIMAAGRPIILGVEGEARALLERARAGIAIQPESAAELAGAIRLLQANRQQAQQFGSNGRAFVRSEFARGPLAARYLTLLKAVAGMEPTAVIEESVEAASLRES
jgi:glycosyltransferase involved in cell wall biosynthesis